MNIRAVATAVTTCPLGLGERDALPNFYNVAVFIGPAAALVVVGHGAGEMLAPLAGLGTAPITLDVSGLPEFVLRTTLRMYAAIVASLIFTFVVATLATKSRKAELVIIPAFDILQSVHVLGFLTFAVGFFLRMSPGSQLGARDSARTSPMRWKPPTIPASFWGSP